MNLERFYGWKISIKFLQCRIYIYVFFAQKNSIKWIVTVTKEFERSCMNDVH